MDLKSFSNTEPYAAYRDESILKEKPEPKDKVSEQGVKDAINHYSKMSNDQLMIELAKQISSQKSKGNSSSMMQTVERIKPLLNDEQRKKLDTILKQVDF